MGVTLFSGTIAHNSSKTFPNEEVRPHIFELEHNCSKVSARIKKRKEKETIAFFWLKMFAVLFLHVGTIATSAALPGVNFDCTNNGERLMTCNFEAQNCTDYNVSLWSHEGERYCLPLQSASGICLCSVDMTLVPDETHLASLQRGGKDVESKNITVKYHIKPNAPSIVSVKESNGNVVVKWQSHINRISLREDMMTNVTYRKEGDTKEVSEIVRVLTADEPCYLEILGEHLAPSTTYVVTAQNFLERGYQPSDRSEEYRFTSPPSPQRLLVAVIISLSLVAVIATCATYGCYVKCRAKYWDSVGDYQNSKLLDLNRSEQEVLKPTAPIISSIYVEPPTDNIKSWSKGSSTESLLQSSGISSGPSSLSGTCTDAVDIITGVQVAISKALMNISPMSLSTNHPLTSSLQPACLGPCNREHFLGSYECDNTTTYSSIVPSCPPQMKTEQSQSGTMCQFEYQDAGVTSTCPDKQASACEDIALPTMVSSYILTSTFCQQGTRDSGRFSHSDESLNCSKASVNGDVASKTGDGHMSLKQMFAGDDDGSLPVCSNYQMFQGLRMHTGILFTDLKSSGKGENSGKFPQKTEDAIKGDTADSFTLARSQESLLVHGDYQAFQGIVKQPGAKIADQKSVGKDEALETFLETTEDASKSNKVNSFMLARSQDSLLVHGDYQAFQGLVKQPGAKIADQKSAGNNEDLEKFLETIEDASKGKKADGFMFAKSQDSLPVNGNYKALQGLNRQSDIKFADLTSSRKEEDLEKFLEKTSEDASEGKKSDGIMLVRSQDSLLVDSNYKAMQGLVTLPCSMTAHQKRVGKEEDLEKFRGKTSEKSSKGDKSDSFMLARSEASLLVEDKALNGLVKHSGNTFAAQKSTGGEEQLKFLDLVSHHMQTPFLPATDQQHEIITVSGYKNV
ncbi:interleukin 4 receptor, tandem duplicate 1 isoform X2 [Nerophis ophidion]|uniref:interleukin 4 receptor, tandem duplicate 1 isoform X2 n=1 Tax=Nerophis ophidion TaxID=159077 RepID=UPI002ADF23B6|nr:interleukin 4 receptor, tandem duplicate 1 isoform X2 [Nerophis ophidion]